jgi:hypothetical protein
LSEAKPLRWSSLLIVPVVILAIWAVICTLASIQRSQLVDELSDRIAHGEVKDAKTALRQMSHLSRPPLHVFVTAAVAPSRQVARQAQTSITELVRNWRADLEAGRHVRRVSQQLEELASGLNEHRNAFSSLDYPWLAQTTEQIVRLANLTPEEMTPELAMNCESLLALANSRTRLASSEFRPGFANDVDAASDEDFSPPSRFALQSIVPEEEEIQNTKADSASESQTIPMDSLLQWSQPKPSDATQLPPPRVFEWNDSSGKTLTLTPIANTRQDLANNWQDVDTRLLLENWLIANRLQRSDYAQELHRRGFGALREDVVRLALSNDTEGRIALVHDLIDTPGIGARAWLLFLAEDEDAEVRLSALTIMATSSDPQLLDSAWQLALNDQDPRIARLATRIRDLRDSSQRH